MDGSMPFSFPSFPQLVFIIVFLINCLYMYLLNVCMIHQNPKIHVNLNLFRS